MSEAFLFVPRINHFDDAMGQIGHIRISTLSICL